MRLEQRKFKAWLAAKKPAEFVGHSCDCHACPIALFYADASGNEVVISDTGDGYKIDRGYGGQRLPYWAGQFIFHVDGERDKRITAGRALEIMELVNP